MTGREVTGGEVTSGAMTAPLRGTQSLVGQMGWVFTRPLLTAIELGWRWSIGVPFLAICWVELGKILTALPPQSAGLDAIDSQNPWVAAVQLARVWGMYEPHVVTVLRWLAPAAALGWVIVSGLGRSLLFKHIDPDLAPRIGFRPLRMMMLQAGWLALLALVLGGWYSAMQWAAATHIARGAEPDLVGYACWAIFLSLGFFTAWAVVNWPLAIAPLLMLLEKRSAISSLAEKLQAGEGSSRQAGGDQPGDGNCEHGTTCAGDGAFRRTAALQRSAWSRHTARCFRGRGGFLPGVERLLSGRAAEGICGVLENVSRRGSEGSGGLAS